MDPISASPEMLLQVYDTVLFWIARFYAGLFVVVAGLFVGFLWQECMRDLSQWLLRRSTDWGRGWFLAPRRLRRQPRFPSTAAK